MDGEIQVYRPASMDEEVEVTEQIDLGTAGRHLIGVSIEDDAGNRSEKQLYVVFNPTSKETFIAVMDLEANNVDPGEVRAITDRLRYCLGRQGVFKVIARNQLEAILSEVGFQLSGYANDDECVIEVGKILGARKMVAGSVARVGSVYSLQVRLLDIASSTTETQHVSEANDIEAVLTTATEEIARELAGFIQPVERTTELIQTQPAEEPRQQPITEPLMVGVLDLEANNIDAGEAKAITDRLRYYLGSQGVFSPIGRNQMYAILNEVGFQLSGACDTNECVIQVGKILGARKMIAGSISKVGTLYSLQVRILDIETSTIEHQAYQDVDGIEKVLTEATNNIAQSLAAQYIPE